MELYNFKEYEIPKLQEKCLELESMLGKKN